MLNAQKHTHMHVRHNRNFRTTAAAKVNNCCLFNKTFSLPGLQLYIPLMMPFFFPPSR